MDIFLILDRDAHWSRIIQRFRNRQYIQEDMYHVWNKDFESDNFSTDEIVDKVNDVLVQKFLKKIKKEELENKISNSNIVLMNAISSLIYEKNGICLDDVISKKELGKILIQPRIEKIRTERNRDGWQPLLPLEKVLNNVFHLIPQING